MTATVVYSTGLVAFGGKRIVNGTSAANLWSDGVVLATAWTDYPECEVAGVLFTVRGRIAKGTLVLRNRWVVRTDDGTFVNDFATRREAVISVQREAQMEAFRALNQAQGVTK